MADRTLRAGTGTLAWRRLRELGRPVYDVLIGDPVREGRLRLEEVGGVVRQTAIVGLVALAGLLALLLTTDLLRRGDLLHLSESAGRFMFVPVSLVPITLLALLLGWWLVTWGAARASPGVQAAVAAAFLLVHAGMGRVRLVELDVEGGFRLAPVLVRVGYFAVPAVLLALALLPRRYGWRSRATAAAQGALLVALLAYFGGILWTHILQAANRVPLQTPFSLESNLQAVQILMLPLLTIGGIAIIEFAQGVSGAVTLHLWRVHTLVARVLLAALVAVKLWVQVVRHAGDWAARLSGRAGVVATTAVILLVLVAGALWSAGVARSGERPDRAKERLILGAAVLLALPQVAGAVLRTVGEFLITQFGILRYSDVVGDLPLARWSSYADALLWVSVLLPGVLLLRRPAATRLQREAGIGLVLLGAWAGSFFVLELAAVEPAWSLELLDVMLTAGIGAFLMLGWSRIDAAVAVRLAAVVVFTWLVLTEGDFISILGALFGLPGVFVVVFGTVFALVADSSFASEDSRRFPRASRPLLWIGYLLVSATIVLWMTATHATDITAQSGDRAFSYVGIPMAVWLLTRLPFEAPERADAAA